MSAATPIDIPLTEVGAELVRLTEDNARLRASLARSTRLYCQTAAERDEARATIERAGISRLPVDHKAEEIRAARALVRDIWEEIETARKPSLETIADLLRAFLSEHGAECDVCEGSGEVADEIMVGDPGAHHGYSTVRVAGDCAHCRGGWVPR